MTLAADIGAAVGGKISDWLQAQSNLAGQIIPWPVAGNIPVGWLECDGRTLNSAEYPRLFAVIGTAYGGDGAAAFNLPDLRGRVPLGRSASHAAGQQVGAESVSVTLDSNNLPSHSHSATFSSTTASSTTAGVAIPAYDAATTANALHLPSTANVLANAFSGTTAARIYSSAAATTTLKPFDVSVPVPAISGSVAIGSTGAGQPLSIPTLPPALVMTWVICTGIGITQPVGYSWHGVKTTYQALSQADLTAKLAADAEFASAAAIMLAAGLMADRVNGEYAQWDFDQAKLDAVNLSLSDLLNKLNPAHASYSARFADMYQILAGTGVVPERRHIAKLVPVLASGGRTSATWSGVAWFTDGALSASSCYSADTTNAVYKAADSGVTGTWWYPQSGTAVGSWIQLYLSQSFFPKTVFFRTNGTGNYRPTEVQIKIGDSEASLTTIATFTVASGSTYSENLLTLPASASCKYLRMVTSSVADLASAGYPIFDFYVTGIVT